MKFYRTINGRFVRKRKNYSCPQEHVSNAKMEQNQEDTNEPLKTQPVNQFETADSNIEIESPPPQDKNDILYIVLIAIGIGFALPFYRFAFDFFFV